MTEKSVGYTTIGGDLMGALGVLANVPKTVVMALLDYLLQQTGYEGISRVLAKPAGPELAPNQEGEKELMPFVVLDACFYLYAGEKLSPDEMRHALRALFPEIGAEQIDGYISKCHSRMAQYVFRGRVFDEETCEDTAHAKYDAAIQKYITIGYCPPCLADPPGALGLGDTLRTESDANLEDVYICPGP